MPHSNETPAQPTVTGIPIVTGRDGQPYMGCDAVVVLLRAVAEACRTNAHDIADARDFAAAVDIEADALAVRAIAHTTTEKRGVRP
ncbi:hypothetical protein [Streptomyces sp. NPDC059649]|uniref:hypothetical protein n=1 Tax=Streptomyces sp. NPDC059649 TaxID=3346895 RepID=UPI0036CC57A2